MLKVSKDCFLQKGERKCIKSIKYKTEEGQNPYIGFTSFQHFNGEKLYSDSNVRPDREQGFYPAASVAYIRILWKEFEPERGVYNYKFIEDIIKEEREHNQTLVFRLLPHSTRARDDVLGWLKELIPCSKRPAGKRVKDSPTAPLFIKTKIVSPKAQKVWAIVGNTDGFRLTVNGEDVLAKDEIRLWTPYNNFTMIELKEGENEFLVKLLQRTESLKFSLGFRIYNGNHWHRSRWCTDL